MMDCKRIFQTMMTESDNATHDLFRYLACASVLVGLGLMVYAVGWRGQPFDMTNFGIGVGGLLAGVGAALKLKPDHPQDIKSED